MQSAVKSTRETEAWSKKTAYTVSAERSRKKDWEQKEASTEFFRNPRAIVQLHVSSLKIQ